MAAAQCVSKSMTSVITAWAGLSILEFADLLGISHTAVSRFLPRMVQKTKQKKTPSEQGSVGEKFFANQARV